MMGKRDLVLGLLMTCGLATACRRDEGSPATAAIPLPAAATPASGPGATPRSPTEFPSTSGEIALGNLTSQIEGLRKRVAAPGADAGTLARLGGLLLVRGQLLGRIADMEAAESLAQQALTAAPRSPPVLLYAASVASSFHQFGQARRLLDQAVALGVNPRELVSTRVALDQATGKAETVGPVLQEQARRFPNPASLAALAMWEAERGDTAAAGRLYVQAQDDYRDVSPFPLAFLYFQEGLMWEKEGRLARARTLYEAALVRLPGYAAATTHLAGVLARTGNRKGAISLLQNLVKTADDPEPLAQLADSLVAGGQSQEGARLRQAAARRFSELVASHPLAFADHAARFELGAGGNRSEAARLARLNLDNRPTREALDLALETALAVRDGKSACQYGDRMMKFSALPVVSRLRLAEAFSGCGRKAEADQQRMLAEQAAPAAGLVSERK